MIFKSYVQGVREALAELPAALGFLTVCFGGVIALLVVIVFLVGLFTK